MGPIAIIIAVFYAVVCVLAIAFMVMIARSTRAKNRRAEPDLDKLGEHEKTWFVVVVVLLAGLLFSTILFTPYGRSAGTDAQIVNVKGIQFAWIVSGKAIKAGRPVEFRLTSADVNHDFGVYNAAGTLLFQVQVEPGRTQDYVYTFKKPGAYTILCLEYCGLGHANMQGELTVEA